MDDGTLAVLGRLPPAEAVLRLFRWVGDEAFLSDIFDRHRGRCYEKTLTFPTLVYLLGDALLQHNGSARESFDRANEAGAMPVSVQAAYGKLRRIPIKVSEAFLAECPDRLRGVMPAIAGDPIPDTLGGFEVLVLDGKTIKKVAKRLKALRTVPGGVLGGQTVVAWSLKSGLAVGMAAHPDGHRNEVGLVPGLLRPLRDRFDGQRLWLADRAYSYPQLLNDLAGETDFFVVRLRSDITFCVDANHAATEARDRSGRFFRQEWGWLGRADSPNRVYVRRITLEREKGDAIVLVTNLLDDDCHPGQDLLDLYLLRGDIERVFQKVTEVFSLQHLIGSTPEASVFQFAFCLLLYNMLQVIRTVVASIERRSVESISVKKLLVDTREHLIAWRLLIGPRPTASLWSGPLTAEDVSRQLVEGLKSVWKKRWTIGPRKKPRAPTEPRATSTHASAHRVLEDHRRRSKTPKPGA